MMKAPQDQGLGPSALQLAVEDLIEDTSTDGPVFAATRPARWRACKRGAVHVGATPGGDGPRPQDRRGGLRVRGAPFMSAQ